jgi:hypothetical protein
MWGRRRLEAAERLVLPLGLGMRASPVDVDLGAVLTAASDLTGDSDSVVDSDAGVAALDGVGVGAGAGVGDGTRGGGAGDRRGGDGATAILATRTGE